MKKQLIKHFADKFGLLAILFILTKSGDYGFYTDGKRCISFLAVCGILA